MNWFGYTARATIVFPMLVLAACSQSRGDAVPADLSDHAGQHIAQAAEESGDLPLAGQLYAQAAANPTNAAAQFHYADALVRGGDDVGAARDLLEGPLATVSDSLPPRDGLGSIFVVTGQPALTLTEYDAVLAARPDDMRALVSKGVALNLLGRHGEAQAPYRKVLALAPGDPVILNDTASQATEE